MKTAMEHHNTGDLWGFLGGAITSIVVHLINIDWQLFTEDVLTSAIKTVILGLIGGGAGIVGKNIIQKHFFGDKKKKKDY